MGTDCGSFTYIPSCMTDGYWIYQNSGDLQCFRELDTNVACERNDSARNTFCCECE